MDQMPECIVEQEFASEYKRTGRQAIRNKQFVLYEARALSTQRTSPSPNVDNRAIEQPLIGKSAERRGLRIDATRRGVSSEEENLTHARTEEVGQERSKTGCFIQRVKHRAKELLLRDYVRERPFLRRSDECHNP